MFRFFIAATVMLCVLQPLSVSSQMKRKTPKYPDQQQPYVPPSYQEPVPQLSTPPATAEPPAPSESGYHTKWAMPIGGGYTLDWTFPVIFAVLISLPLIFRNRLNSLNANSSAADVSNTLSENSSDAFKSPASAITPSPAARAQRATLSVVPTPPPPTTELPQQAFSDSGPVKGLALRLKRSQRTNALNKILFVLDARMDVSAENRALIQKYSLGNRVVYDSANREAYAAAAKARLENSGNHPGFFDSTGRQFLGVGKSFLNLGMAAVHATVAVLSLRITIDSLMKGVHVECKDMDELLEAEGAIMQAAQNLKGHLDTVTTFDGREETFEL